MKKNTYLSKYRYRWLQSKTFLIMLIAFLSMFSNNAFAQVPMHELQPVSPSNNVFPFGSTTSNRAQWLYYPSEFTPPVATGLITKVYFKLYTTSRAATTYTDLEVL